MLAFATRTLETNPNNALLGYGDAAASRPWGSRCSAAVGDLTIMQALPVRPIVVKTVAASYFPRTISVAANRTTLFLANFNGGSVQVISTVVP